MRSSLRLALEVIAGIPVLLAGCGNSGSTRARDAQVATGGSVVESGGNSSSASAGTQTTGGNTVGDSGGTTRLGTEDSSGGRRSGGGSTALGGNTTGGAGGGGAAGGNITGGNPVGSGGAVAGGTQSGGRSAFGGTTIAGGSSAGGSGGTSSRGGASAGGTSLAGGAVSPGGVTSSGGASAVAGATGSGGASAVAGATGAPVFPPRFVGNIDQEGKIAPDFVKYWDQVTPESAGKWYSVQQISGSTYNWTALDALYAYAEENKIPFKEMCFIWGDEQPAWLMNLTATTGPEAVRRWMKAFCDRYPNTRLIDVVNEPSHSTPPWADAIGGGTNTTWDWITNSFKWARELCPNAILIINDYNIVEYAKDNQRFIDIVKTVRNAGAPIDAIGSETHDANNLSASALKTLLDKLISDTGLPVYITEYGIGLSNDEQQRAQYAAHIPVFWDNPNVKGVTVWGYRSGAIYRAYMNLMNSDGSMRPAMTWLMDFLGR